MSLSRYAKIEWPETLIITLIMVLAAIVAILTGIKELAGDVLELRHKWKRRQRAQARHWQQILITQQQSNSSAPKQGAPDK